MKGKRNISSGGKKRMSSDFRGAESGHWYASNRTVELGLAAYPGAPVGQVPAADGKGVVNATSQNANKWGLAKGVTSVLKRLAKPVLGEWGERMAARAAVAKIDGKLTLAERFLKNELDEPAYLEECLKLKAVIGSTAADIGSLIHADIERGFLGQSFKETEVDGEAYFQTVLSLLTQTFGPDVKWVPEKPFYHPLGFGGRTDVLGYRKDALIVVDFKTREFDQEHVDYAIKAKAKGQKTLGKLTPYETEPMQIAANLQGHGGAHGRKDGKAFKLIGGNLYVSRLDPEPTFMYEYKSDELEKAWQCFTALLTVDQLQSGVLGR
jgi:hypothetical protein